MNVTPACSNFQDCEDPLATISGNSISVYYSLDLNVRLKSNPWNPTLQLPKSVGGILGIFPSTRRVPYGGVGFTSNSTRQRGFSTNFWNPTLRYSRSVGGILIIFSSTRRWPYGGWGLLKLHSPEGIFNANFDLIFNFPIREILLLRS